MRAVEGNRDTVLEPSGQPCYYSHNKLSTQNFMYENISLEI